MMVTPLAVLGVLRILYSTDQRLSPDGERYLAMARGEQQPQPFHRRWFMPWARRKATFADWASTAPIFVVSCTLLLAMGMVGDDRSTQLVAAALFLGLPLVRINLMLPVLVDMPAMAFALCAACAWRAGHPWQAVFLVLVSGACKECGPVFAALYAGTPWLLVGLVAVRWWGGAKPARVTLAGLLDAHNLDRGMNVGRAVITDVDRIGGTVGLADPLLQPSLLGVAKHIRQHHRHDFQNWQTMLLPWGALAVLAPLGGGWDRETLCCVIGLAIGYGQLLIATDNARLYQWAAPLVIVLACRVHSPWLTVACVLHWFNPYRGV